jgi:hypothetical protein
MKPEPSLSDADPALEPEARPARRDPQRIERPGASDERGDWPERWEWEEDNLADGLGVGPFPAGRKPPRRAERPAPLEDEAQRNNDD